LVAFAQDALLMVRNTQGTQKNQLLDAVERLDQIDLGDETYMARGMEKGYEQVLPGLAPDRVSRLIVLTDGYTKEEHDCYEWTRAAKAKGIVVSTMGLGLDFNEELLISLADVSGGNAYFIDEPGDIPNAFRQELAQVKSITWRDLSLSLTLPTDIALRRAHRVAPTIVSLDPQDDRIVLGDLQANQPPSVLLELIVPPRPAGNYRLAQATLHGRPAGNRQTEPIAVQDLLIHYTERPSQAGQTDRTLMAAVQKVSAFKLQNQALEEAARGNVAGATRRLRMAGERLIEMGQKDLGQTMLVEAELMEKEGQMSAEGTKKLRYGTRKLSRDRK
jgi:Ca-activated chloride channel family protein